MPADTLQPAPHNPEEMTGEPLPPVSRGYIRLYRGDVVDEERNPIIVADEGRSAAEEAAGHWFTNNPNHAEGYAAGRNLDHEYGLPRLRFVDVPEHAATAFNTRNLPSDVMTQTNGTGGDSTEWLLPDEIIEQAREYRVKDVDQLYEPNIEEGIRVILVDPELQAYLQEMGLNKDKIEVIINDPVSIDGVLSQIFTGLSQGHFEVADKEEKQMVLRELILGVESAHKERYLGSQPKTAYKKPGVDNLTQDSDDW